MNGISDLIKEAQERSFTFAIMWEHCEKVLWTREHVRCVHATDTKFAVTLISDFSVCRTMRDKLLLFMSHLVCGALF